jgi:selenide,water dikinase
MLPGHVARLYTRDECHINLRSLCHFAGAQLIVDRAIGLDLAQNRVLCERHPAIGFDLVSIDIGSTPTLPGGAGDAVAAKPIAQFLHWWQQMIAQSPPTLGIIGGGTGGVELALNMQPQLKQTTIHLFQRDRTLMPRHNRWIQRHFHRLLRQRGIQLHLGETVETVQQGKVQCASGLAVPCTQTVWVTQASAPDWIRASGLTVDAEGFILVDDALRSVSHAQVFAAGDIATMQHYVRPKAGVFAVRQGKPLAENLRRSLLQRPLQPYRPQRHYLSLIGTGEGTAVASYGAFGLQARWLWHLKDRIDRAFMQRFTQWPTMEPLGEPPRCLGCAAKVGSNTLERVLQRIQPNFWGADEVVIGLDALDDAAVVQIPPGKVLVQTVDYFPALISDPFLFGQVCTNHSLSDLYAMGATPQSALAIATLPYATPAKQEETLYQLLSGAIQALQPAALIGGHTVEGEQLAFGLTCNGMADPERILRKTGMQPGQVLILTKPLGTGTLFAADMRHQSKPQWIDAAIASMLVSNQAASTCLLQFATACTDVTGFGLLGHLIEMVRSSPVDVQLTLENLPLLPGARDCVRHGILSSLHPQNLRALQWIANVSDIVDHPDFELLFDPQTSGGLLASVPSDRAAECLRSLRAAGYGESAIVGTVLPRSKSAQPITIKKSLD